MDEKTPLLGSGEHALAAKSPSQRIPKRVSVSSVSHPDIEVENDDGVKLRRHITLWTAVFIIIGNVVGSGIFVSPKGVTANINSVGASIIIWGITGLYNLAQALCYAELGGIIPKAGGDYAYIHEILGPLPAFMCAWVHIVVIASSSCAVIARTAGLYIIQPLGLDCRLDIITLLAVLIIGKFVVITVNR